MGNKGLNIELRISLSFAVDIISFKQTNIEAKDKSGLGAYETNLQTRLNWRVK